MFGNHNIVPEPDETLSAPESSPRWGLIGLALTLLVATGWFGAQVIGNDDSTAATGRCISSEPLLVIVAPAMADLVDEAVRSLDADGQCVELEVRTATVAEVSAAQDEVDEGEEHVLPDLWVPDSPAWQSVLSGAGLTGKVLDPALATTPVGLASGSSQTSLPTWLDALSSPQLVKQDPLARGAFALTLLAPLVEARSDRDVGAAQSALVPVAQRFGAKLAAGQPRPVTIDNILATSRRLIAVTERDFLIAQRGNAALTWMTPDTGAAVLNFPLVQPGAEVGGLSAGSGGLDVAGRVGAKIAAWFTSEEGSAAIADDLLRGPDGAPLPDGESVSVSRQLPAANRAQVDSTMKSWGTLTVPSSLLAVIDASASMDTVEGASTRMGLAVGAALTALDVFPSHARIGMWAFSTDQGGPGRDWRELAPLRRLDAPTGDGLTQTDLLLEQADVLPGLTGGGRGTYDTMLAAYKVTTREYNPAYSNALVLMTDGANDDPGSISLARLVSELKQLHDPDRPVRIIAVGLSADADMASLRRMADATGGHAYEARDPQDILVVLASALMTR